jgi:hypothetical protein
MEIVLLLDTEYSVCALNVGLITDREAWVSKGKNSNFS